MNKPLVFGFPLMFGVAGLWWFAPLGSAQRPMPARHVVAASQAFAPQARSTELSRSPTQANLPETAKTAETDAQEPLPAAPVDSADTARSDDTVWVEGEPMSREEVAFRLEAKFAEDGPSDGAGRNLERSISAQFGGQDAVPATLNKAECRGRLCRIDLTAADKYAASKAFQGLYRGALVNAGGALGPVYESTPDGRTRLVIYAARDGSIDVR